MTEPKFEEKFKKEDVCWTPTQSIPITSTLK